MKTKGFFVCQLRLEGTNVEPASVQFEKGLNVITGPSDTGKSYIWNCINYMLGAEDPVKTIEQSKNYTKVFLEISDYNNNRYTLERSLNGGLTNLYNCSFNEIVGVKPEPLKSKHGDQGKSVSEFLLDLCGIYNVKVLRNKSTGRTQALTIRTLAPFFMVNETAIMEERSPILSGDRTSTTAEKMNFNYLLTGKGAEDIIALAKTDVQKANKDGKLYAYEAMIKVLKQSLDSDILGQMDPLECTRRLEYLNTEIFRITDIIYNNKAELSNLESDLSLYWEKHHKIKSRLIVLNELLNRFELLKEHYKSDVARLDFISEGEYYFEQLESINCPFCGNTVEKIESCPCENMSEKTVLLQTACESEMNKVKTQMNDLDGTVDRLTIEKEEKQYLAKELADKIEIIQKEINRLLETSLNPRNDELKMLIEEKDRINEYSIKSKQIDELIFAKTETEEIVIERYSSDQIESQLDRKALRRLCDIIEETLRGYKYDGAGIVEFVEKCDGPEHMNMDFLVNGQHRQSHGKGVRAILHAAFNIALLKYCRSCNYLRHPGLVVLDSPLTTFKPEKGDSSDERVRKDVRLEFFKYLKDMLQDEQVIILENEEPDVNTKLQINCIEFTRNSEKGRYGFFPR